MEPQPSLCRALCPVLMILCIMLSVAGILMYPPSFHYLSHLFLHVYSMGNAGLGLFFLSYPVAMAIGFPVTVLDIAVGFLYPWKLGFGVVWLGKAVGCILCYFIARVLLKDVFHAWAKKKPLLGKIELVMKRHPWKYVFLFRIIYIPSTIKNYGLAALEAPFIPYFVSSVVLTFFTSIWQVTLGREGKTLVQAMNVQLSPQEIWFLVGAGVLSLGAVAILVLYTHKVLQDLESLTELREGPSSSPPPSSSVQISV